MKTRSTPSPRAYSMSLRQKVYLPSGGWASPMKTTRSCRPRGSFQTKNRLLGRRPVRIRPPLTSTCSTSNNPSRRELGEQVHAELGHQVVAGAEGHVPHPRPDRDQPGPGQSSFVRQCSSPLSVQPKSCATVRHQERHREGESRRSGGSASSHVSAAIAASRASGTRRGSWNVRGSWPERCRTPCRETSGPATGPSGPGAAVLADASHKVPVAHGDLPGA